MSEEWLLTNCLNSDNIHDANNMLINLHHTYGKD